MKIKTDWDLTKLYKNEKDPQIKKDLEDLEKKCTAFNKKHKGKNFEEFSKDKFLKILKEYETLIGSITTYKPYRYYALRKSLNIKDQVATAGQVQVVEKISKALNKMTFFGLQIGAISKKRQKEILKDVEFSHYKYYLSQVFEGAKYRLSEEAENVTTLLSQPAYGMWIDVQEDLLYGKTVSWKGKEIPIPEASGMVPGLPKSQRRKLHGLLNDVYKSNAGIAKAEMNAVVTYKKITDELRGYKKPYSATIRGYQNRETVIEGMVDVVTQGFKISKSFYKLHADLLGEEKLSLADRSAKVGNLRQKFDFEKTVEIVRSAFGRVDQKYVDILDSYLENGQIDVFPKEGKRGGAFCWGQGDEPVYVMLNHIDSIRSVETLAHEMGHAFHSEMIKKQPDIYKDYPTSTAEVASTFFEQIVVDELLLQLSDKEKLVLLHNKLLGDISTIFRQIAFFNYEVDLHETVRREGSISSEKMAEMMQKHLKNYLGPAVEVTKDDGYFYVGLSHARRFFYVYSYAYGQMISRAMYEKWKENSEYANQVELFLSSGESKSPYDTFKMIGINTRDPELFKSALRGIDKDVKELRKLAKKIGKI